MPLKTPDNPLLARTRHPSFSRISPTHVVPAVEHVLDEARRGVAALSANLHTPTWELLAAPLDEINERIARTWAPIGHLHAVADNPELREAFNQCLPLLTDYRTEIAQNEALFEGFERLARSDAYANLEQSQKRTVDNAIRDFKLEGVALGAEDKERYRVISARLSELSARFGENVLDATQAWTREITEETELEGLPDSVKQLALETAQRENRPGWLLTLEAPSYFPVMTYADSRELRREMYEASTTRASDKGPNAGQWDNTEVMHEILKLRQDKAQLLGFENYAEYSLATKMARSPREVIDFLENLVAKAKPVAERELSELKKFAADQHSADSLEAWDIPYYSEKLRAHRYAITQEELRPYFPIEKVLEGLFEITGRVFGLRVEPVDAVEVWDPSVQFFAIYDRHDTLRGEFYLDVFSRPHKRGGAWMDECVARNRSAGELHNPVAFLTCNFTPPVGDKPALLTHDEVTTLFHEFGHGLHHMLTLVDHPSVSGINGVEWDAVELPSQMLENWCWDPQALLLMSCHWESGEALPTVLLDKLRAAKNFQAGMKMLRQLEFALFDLKVHLEVDPARGPRVQETLAKVRRDVAVAHPPAFNRFAHAFSHIFSGGYAAGYYSYLWAEVLSSDAFSLFEHNGVFDETTGTQFRQCILEQGGSQDAMTLFVSFRGREPNIDALLRHTGISDARAASSAAGEEAH